MDTREKILDASAARALAASGNLPRVAAVVGSYDVLITAQVDRLRRVREQYPDSTLAVVIAEVSGALLATRARAELAAGLADVDLVVIPDQGDWEQAVDSLAPVAVFRDEEIQQRERQALIEHVHSRQRI